MQSNGASTRGACPSSPLLIMPQSSTCTSLACGAMQNAVVLIGQMQLQNVLHNLDFLRFESINAISATVLLTHYLQSSPC